jgi:hypothetical protein
MKLKTAYHNKHWLNNCDEVEPQKPQDPWCSREDARLQEIMTSIPSPYIGKNGVLRWELLVSEFPHRTVLELQARRRSLKQRAEFTGAKVNTIKKNSKETFARELEHGTLFVTQGQPIDWVCSVFESMLSHVLYT